MPSLATIIHMSPYHIYRTYIHTYIHTYVRTYIHTYKAKRAGWLREPRRATHPPPGHASRNASHKQYNSMTAILLITLPMQIPLAIARILRLIVLALALVLINVVVAMIIISNARKRKNRKQFLIVPFPIKNTRKNTTP